MENFEDELSNGFSINIQKLIGDNTLLAVTRLLGADLLARPYMAVGDFFKSLTDNDLQTLLKASEPDTQDEVMDDILLIGMMLRSAEGLEPLNELDQSKDIVQKIITFLVLESLYRKGLIKLYHENMTFGDDMEDKMIAEKA
jgi:hypothetical protein